MSTRSLVPAADTLMGWAIRLPLKLVPRGLVVPVLRGPMAGQRWIVGASVDGCWLGTFEGAKQDAFARAASNARVVFDVGAHVGFYTVLSATRVPPLGRVVAFEPLPRNLMFLQRHVQLNRLTNVTIRPHAVSDLSGTWGFAEGANSCMGRLDPAGTLTTSASPWTD